MLLHFLRKNKVLKGIDLRELRYGHLPPSVNLSNRLLLVAVEIASLRHRRPRVVVGT